MRIEIDREKCCGVGNCVLTAPDLFDLDDEENVAVAIVPAVTETRRAEVERVIDECPTMAIDLVE
jgi:ferredoxin